MGTYTLLASLAIKKHFSDRARVIVWLLVDTLGVAVMPFIWLAVYGARDHIEGFSRGDIVTYFILIFLISLFATSHSADYIHRAIMKGDLNGHLVKPFPALLYHFMTENGYKVLAGGFGIIVFTIMHALFPAYVLLPSSSAALVLFVGFLILSRLHSFAIQAMVGLATFWLKETGALMQFRFVLERLFGGEFGPLSLFPASLQQFALALPFQYLYFVPVGIYLGKFTRGEIVHHVLFSSVWLAVYALIIFALWRRGLKRYDGVGI